MRRGTREALKVICPTTKAKNFCREDWTGARNACQTWLRLDPGNVEARRLWIACLLESGDKVGARKEMEIVRRLRPRNLPELEAWFEKQGQ